MSMNKQEAQAIVAGWHLGQTSQRYESSGLGAGTISTGKDDHGGASYGSYQLSSASGTLKEYLSLSRYGKQFAGLEPATPAFDAKWREIARTDPGFGVDQHAFIGRSHYAEQLQRLENAGLDMRGRGRAVQDCVWSTSVQLRGLTTRIFREGLQARFGPHYDLAKLSDREIVESVQEYKAAHTTTLFRSSPAWHKNLLARAHHERADLVRLADAEQRAPAPLDRLPTQPTNRTTTRRESTSHGAHHGSQLLQAQAELAHLGYTGLDGRLVSVDGRMGKNTRYALAQYQRDHALPVTRRLDVATKTRLDADDRTLASSEHPAHRLYQQSLNAVYELDTRMGVPHGKHSMALARQAAVEAARAGLDRVDRIEVGRDGRFAQAVEFRAGIDFGPTNRISAPINVSQALTQTLEASSVQAEQAMAGRRSPTHRESAPIRVPFL